MAMALDPYGVQRDYLAFDEIYVENEWDGLWRVHTNRTDSGWFAEIAIPWKTLRYPATVRRFRTGDLMYTGTVAGQMK